MKTKDNRDPLDRKIDELLSDQPVRPSDDFIKRTLEAASSLEQDRPAEQKKAKIIPFALPIAAGLLLALFMSSELQQGSPSPATGLAKTIAPQSSPSALVGDLEITSAEFQEILLLEEGLSGLAAIESDSFGESGLLDELEALYFDLES